MSFCTPVTRNESSCRLKVFQEVCAERVIPVDRDYPHRAEVKRKNLVLGEAEDWSFDTTRNLF